MKRVSVLSVVSLGMLHAFATGTLANSYFVGGTIRSVAPDRKSCVIEGVDHYGNKSGGLIVAINVPNQEDGCYILDGRLVRREVAMVPGRTVFSIQHRLHLVLSEAATRAIGEVVRVNGDTVTLKTLLGQDTRETNITIEANAQCGLEGKTATRETLLTTGRVVRVTPPRPATVNAYSEKALATGLPSAMSVALQGIIKDGQLLYLRPDGSVAELPRSARTGLSVDACNPHGVKVPAGHPCMANGCVAAAAGFVKRGAQKPLETPTLEGLESYLMAFWPEPGRVDGQVVSFDAAAGNVAVKSLGTDGLRDMTLALPRDAQVTLDGARSPAAEALKAGMQVTFFPAKPQTLEAWESVTAVANPPRPPAPVRPPASVQPAVTPQPAAKPAAKPPEAVELPTL